MIHQIIEAVDPEQRDAVRHALPIVRRLAFERAKAWPTNINLRHVHEACISGLERDLDMIAGRVEGWTGNELEQTALCELRLAAKARGVPGPPRPAVVPLPRSGDNELLRLEAVALKAQIAEQKAGASLARARTRFLNMQPSSARLRAEASLARARKAFIAAKDATASASKALDLYASGSTSK